MCTGLYRDYIEIVDRKMEVTILMVFQGGGLSK